MCINIYIYISTIPIPFQHDHVSPLWRHPLWNAPFLSRPAHHEPVLAETGDLMKHYERWIISPIKLFWLLMFYDFCCFMFGLGRGPFPKKMGWALSNSKNDWWHENQMSHWHALESCNPEHQIPMSMANWVVWNPWNYGITNFETYMPYQDKIIESMISAIET